MKIKNFVTGLLAALCLTAVLCPAALAAPVEDDGSWDKIIANFLDKYEDRNKSCSITLGYRNLVTGEEHFYPAADMLVNSGQRLCFVPGFAFGAGEWEAIVCTQFTPTYHLYKEPRYGTLTFTVI